jgi:hypothetical protein
MDVTLFGMAIEVRLEQEANAQAPMLVTLLGMVVFMQPVISILLAVSIIALQALRESYTAFPLPTVIEVKPLQNQNALLAILVTLLGMDIVVRLLQPENAS